MAASAKGTTTGQQDPWERTPEQITALPAGAPNPGSGWPPQTGIHIVSDEMYARPSSAARAVRWS
ncbi:hypothetical protein ACIBL5_06815 [Streptomyces sp. NPDC050516]|uniref:hypothetical protein n=1 Tax=Streptomyces sp. NPDC050516 TaxID=3365621 RepID=UPI0037B0F75C